MHLSNDARDQAAGNRMAMGTPAVAPMHTKRTAAAAPLAVDPTDTRPRCVECGLVEGRRGHACLAHPRPPGLPTALIFTMLAPFPLALVLGPIVLLSFLPLFVCAWYIKSI